MSKEEIKESYRDKISTLYHKELEAFQMGKQCKQPYLTIVEEQKIKNAYTFHLYLEDHTLGNLLRMELSSNNKQVRFAGYRVPHPLEDKVEIKVHTADQTDPLAATDNAITDLVYKYDCLEKDLEEQQKKFQQYPSHYQ